MAKPRHVAVHCSDWTPAERSDVAEIVQETTRDGTGISYQVSVALRSLAVSAYEMGEDQLVVWSCRVDNGSDDAHCGGGHAFVKAARQQAKIADEIAAACRL